MERLKWIWGGGVYMEEQIRVKGFFKDLTHFSVR